MSHRPPALRPSRAAALALVLAACAGGKAPTPVDLESLDLFLEPVPQATGLLEYRSPGRTYAGPARVEITGTDPLSVEAEDFDEAELLRFTVISEAPPAYRRGPGGEWIDIGGFVRDGDRFRIDVDRAWGDGRQAEVDLAVDMSAEAQPAPTGWLRPGTRLFYGVAFDDKPITRIVPMGVTVTVEEPAEEGGFAFSWRADLDENTRTDVRGRTWQQGRRQVSAEAIQAGIRVADRFDETAPDSFFEGASSLVLPLSVARNLETYGGAGFEDADLDNKAVLERLQEREVQLRADGGLWTLPAWVTATSGAEGVYVVLADPELPLLLTASRPGWKLRLMAIATAETAPEE